MRAAADAIIPVEDAPWHSGFGHGHQKTQGAGGRPALPGGGIWHEHIVLGRPEDIRNEARYAFAQAAPGGGYILGSTHSLVVDARSEDILEMKGCRDEWGIYPIDPRRFV